MRFKKYKFKRLVKVKAQRSKKLPLRCSMISMVDLENQRKKRNQMIRKMKKSRLIVSQLLKLIILLEQLEIQFENGYKDMIVSIRTFGKDKLGLDDD